MTAPHVPPNIAWKVGLSLAVIALGVVVFGWPFALTFVLTIFAIGAVYMLFDR